METGIEGGLFFVEAEFGFWQRNRNVQRKNEKSVAASKRQQRLSIKGCYRIITVRFLVGTADMT